MLKAKDPVPDVVRGLGLGADDYMTKPSLSVNFSPGFGH
jgi:DNA-binding response OmpR family regulator